MKLSCAIGDCDTTHFNVGAILKTYTIEYWGTLAFGP